MTKKDAHSVSPFFSQSLIYISGWLLLVLVEIWLLQRVTAKDQSAYQRLMEHSESERISETVSYKAHQQRFNVHKFLLFTHQQDRLNVHLQSVYSELLFDQNGGNENEIIEEFQQVKCIMQEKLIHETPYCQYVRLLEADHGTYHYKTQEFIGHHVKLFRYLVPGHHLISSFKNSTPLMEGMAKQVHVFFSHQEPLFKATEFRAHIQEISESL